MSTHCFACKESNVLTDEHVIPQALGGRLKAKLYCKICNENFGKDIDAEIANQFGNIATILKIKRERGKLQPFEVEDIDKKINLVFDGEGFTRKDPIVEIEIEPDSKTLKSANITARSKKELEKRIKDIQRRYQVQRDIKTFQEVHPGPTDTKYEITIDNTLIRRAVAKIAYSLFCIKVPKEVVFESAFDEVREYFKDGSGPDLACANFIHTRFMSDYIRPLHKIHIALNRQRKVVVGYVSLFGIYRFTVLLSGKHASQLEWADLDYTFDPVRRKEVFGNERFRAPNIAKEDILHPKQSKVFVQQELNRGQKLIESYVDNYEFLGTELSRPTS
ncbi:MAG: HNH endonuclease [Desulfobulbaceae bacterium]|nr:HNH endonuclease [Desulfobulbaceae bacterium]